MSPEMVQELEAQLKGGNVSLWEKGYYAFLRRSVLQEHPERFPIFEYDYSKRVVLYAWVNANVLGDGPIDFLEFGVFKGDSFQRWLGLNQHPESRFFGFDTFEGLPESWDAGAKGKGHFDVGGRLPVTSDPRARFIPGLFQETLPPFAGSFKPRGRLVLHLDADLYSSTLFVLMTMNRHIQPGTVLVFDEFIAEDEFAAFPPFLQGLHAPVAHPGGPPGPAQGRPGDHGLAGRTTGHEKRPAGHPAGLFISGSPLSSGAP